MKDYNFDNPQALDLDLLENILNELLEGKDSQIPTYDFCQHKRYHNYIELISGFH